jgi:hypothetical protein
MTTDAREPGLEELQPHAITSGEYAEANSSFDYGIMTPTRTFEHTFTQPGQHPFSAY